MEPNEFGNLRLQWRDEFSETIYGLANLSDGTQRFIALTVLFMQPKFPKVIVIGESELGLHPYAIEKLSSIISKAANRDNQIITATQSADLISDFQPSDTLTVDIRNGESHIKRLDAKDLKL